MKTERKQGTKGPGTKATGKHGIGWIDRKAPPPAGTIYYFDTAPKYKVGTWYLPAKLVFGGLGVSGVGDALVLTEPDGPPWPDADISLAFWNKDIAPLVALVEPHPPGDLDRAKNNYDEAKLDLARAKAEGRTPALRPPAGAHSPTPRADLIMVPIDQIDATHNVRQAVDEQYLFQLGESIKDVGLLQPVIVRKLSKGEAEKDADIDGHTKRFRVVAGHQRLEAARRAGEEFIEAKVYGGVDDAWEARARLAENVQRQDLSHIDLARVFAAAQRAGMSAAQIAAEAHLSTDHVYRHLSLTRLCPPVAELVESGKLPIHQAELIARVGDPARQIELTAGCVSLRWDARKGAWGDHEWADKESPKDYVKPMEDLRADVATTMRSLAAVGRTKWERESREKGGVAEGFAKQRPCEGCPNNTASYADQPMLFAGIHPQGSDKKGFCTNAACYEKKMAAWEKVREKRRAEREKAESAQLAKAQRAGLAVCGVCRRIAGEDDQFVADKYAAGGKVCPKCAEKAAKRATRHGGGEDYQARQKKIEAARAAFPSTAQEKFALGTWQHGEKLLGEIGKRVADGTLDGDGNLGSLQCLLLRIIFGAAPDGLELTDCSLGSGKKRPKLPAAADLTDGLSDEVLAAMWSKVELSEWRTKPGVDNNGVVVNVPLPKNVLACIEAIESVAREWNVPAPPRPKEKDFAAAHTGPVGKGTEKNESNDVHKKLLTTIATSNKAAALAALAECDDLAGLQSLDDLKGDWRRAAVAKRIRELSDK